MKSADELVEFLDEYFNEGKASKDDIRWAREMEAHSELMHRVVNAYNNAVDASGEELTEINSEEDMDRAANTMDPNGMTSLQNLCAARAVTKIFLSGIMAGKELERRAAAEHAALFSE